MKPLYGLVAGACAALVLISCAGNPPAPAAAASNAPAPNSTAANAAAPQPADYAALAAQGGGQVYTLDPSASRIRIYAFRGGRAAMAGHNHVLTAKDYTGSVFVPDKGMGDAHFDLKFPLDKLIVDDPKLRAETGGAFSTVLGEAAIAGTREHMLGDRNLDAAHYPDVAIHSVSIAGELPRIVATVDVTMHGVTRQQLVPLDATVDGGQLKVSGAFALRQTDFGVHPYSVLGGLLAVQDEVAIEFTLIGKAAAS